MLRAFFSLLKKKKQTKIDQIRKLKKKWSLSTSFDRPRCIIYPGPPLIHGGGVKQMPLYPPPPPPPNDAADWIKEKLNHSQNIFSRQIRYDFHKGLENRRPNVP